MSRTVPEQDYIKKYIISKKVSYTKKSATNTETSFKLEQKLHAGRALQRAGPVKPPVTVNRVDGLQGQAVDRVHYLVVVTTVVMVVRWQHRGEYGAI